MKKDIGIGVIGIGMGIGLTYLNDEPDSIMEVRGLCALPLEEARKACEKNGICLYTDDYKELIAKKNIDVIAVYSPDHMHAKQIIDALNAGKHVIVTKPMVTNLRDALEIMEIAEKRGLKFAVGETCRFYTSFLSIKKMLDDGDLGNIVFSEAHYVHDLREVMQLTPWRLQVPQDFMYGCCCHPVDSIVWFAGQADEVQAFGVNSHVIEGYPIEDTFLINIKFKNGHIARVLGAYGIVGPPYPMMGLTVYGTKGTATADFTDYEPSGARVILDKIEHNPVMEMNFKADFSGAYGQGDAVKRYMADFEEALVNNKKPGIDAREGVKTIAILSAAWESVRNGGKTVKVYDSF